MRLNSDDIRDMLEEIDDEKFEEAVQLRLGERRIERQSGAFWRCLPYVLGAACLLLVLAAATANIIRLQRADDAPAATVSGDGSAQEGTSAQDTLLELRSKYQTCSRALIDLVSADTFTRYGMFDYHSVVEAYVSGVSYEDTGKVYELTVGEVFQRAKNSGMKQGVSVRIQAQDLADGLVLEAGMTVILSLSTQKDPYAIYYTGVLADPSLFYVFKDGAQEFILAAYEEDRAYDGMTRETFVQLLISALDDV